MALKGFAGLFAAAIFAAGTAFAQGPSVPPASTQGPGSIPVGPLTVYPGIDLAIGHDDNLFLRPTFTNSSAFSIISPYVRAEAKPGAHKFEGTLRIDRGLYYSSHNDDYTDYSLLGSGNLVFSGRAGLLLRVEARHGHDPRGSTDRPSARFPDEYDNYGLDGVFRYGASGARGRIEIDAGAYERRYTNNRLSTSQSDRITSQFGGTFFWRVMPRTEILAQAQRRNIDYQDAASTQSSVEDRFYLGAKWEATAATTGYAKFGRMNKSFDSGTRTDISGTSSWDVGVRWSPLTYSVFDFVTSKQTGETTGIGDSSIGKNYGVTWSHAWSSRLRTQALGTFGNTAFTGTTGLGRKDDTTSIGLKVDYDFRRWLRFGAAYTHIVRDSNLDDFDYKRNLFMLTVGATL